MIVQTAKDFESLTNREKQIFRDGMTQYFNLLNDSLKIDTSRLNKGPVTDHTKTPKENLSPFWR